MMFAKWEIMCCMVKLNDLEELAKPPLGGTLGASSSTPPKDAAMDLEEEEGRLEEANEMAQFIPSEANYGMV